jgi:signal transduction histidine kinase
VVEDLRQILFIPEHISLIVKKPLPIIDVDRVRIQQVFQNLISNSAKFIDKKDGLIEIDFKETKKKYQFSVKDNGIGIAPEYHEKIFKIFQSLEKATSSSGIGLSIVKKIVNLYDGTIWLESTPEIGTTFYFTISKSD